jgi:hypothetical protein
MSLTHDAAVCRTLATPSGDPRRLAAVHGFDVASAEGWKSPEEGGPGVLESAMTRQASRDDGRAHERAASGSREVVAYASR